MADIYGKGNYEIHPYVPPIVYQPLSSCITELYDAVKELKSKFPHLDDQKAIELALKLKELGLPRKV